MSAATDVAGTAIAARSPAAEGFARFLENRLAVACALVVLAMVLLAIGAPWFAPHDPNETDLLRRLQPPVWLDGGEWAFPLGCDALGRDLLSRLIHGARVSISVGAVVILFATVVGIAAGLLAGYLRGWVDTVISRIVDILLGFPYLIFAIGLMAMMGPGLHNVAITLIAKEWVVPCRLVRGETLAAREMEYVEAARAIGVGSFGIMIREILPNILSPVIVVATIRLAHVIILEASLSFLGLGVQPPDRLLGFDGGRRPRIHARRLVGQHLRRPGDPGPGARDQRREPGPARCVRSTLP